jgi:hypothetical protein
MKYEVATCFNSFHINLFYLIIWSGPWLGDNDNLAPKLGKVAHALFILFPFFGWRDPRFVSTNAKRPKELGYFAESCYLTYQKETRSWTLGFWSNWMGIVQNSSKKNILNYSILLQ